MTRYRTLLDLAAAEEDFGLALGVFDGVHLGHQAVIKAARGRARTGVLTFEPHPVQVLAPERAPRRILASLEHKEIILQRYGVDFLVVLDFTAEFAAQRAEEFAKDLVAAGSGILAAGADWVFGKERRGTMTRLAEWCPEVEVCPVPAVMHKGERISSTRIRQCLRDANLSGAAEMLGRDYAVYGEVKKGAQLGRAIGFPTANVAVPGEQLPGNGVYQVQGNWGDGWQLGVANVGVKPTVTEAGQRSLEVHFLSGVVPDDYGWMVEVAFANYLRGERRFDSVEALTVQIGRDIEEARRR